MKNLAGKNFKITKKKQKTFSNFLPKNKKTVFFSRKKKKNIKKNRETQNLDAKKK